MRIINFRFNIICPYCIFCPAIRKDSVSRFRFPLPSHAPFSWAIPPVCCLKYPYSCFSYNFCLLGVFIVCFFSSVCLYIVIVVTGCCNKSFSLFFLKCLLRVPEFMLLRNPQCCRTLFSITYNPSVSSLECKALFIETNFLVLWSICPSSILVGFKNNLKYFTRRWMGGGFLVIYSFDEISAIGFGFGKFSGFFSILIYFSSLFDGIRFQYS